MATLFSETLSDLWRNFILVVFYVAAAVVVLFLFRGTGYVINQLDIQETAPFVASLLGLLLALVLAAAMSGIQSAAFAAFGAAVDGSMWKYGGWRDALKRFFVLWFIINLLLLTLIDLRVHLFSIGMQDLSAMVELLLLGAHMAALPAGAAMMFWGALEWGKVPAALTPLLRFFQLTLAPVGVAFLQYLMIITRAAFLDGESAGMLAATFLTDLPLIFMDVLIFALVWRICLLDQRLPRDAEQDPFDF